LPLTLHRRTVGRPQTLPSPTAPLEFHRALPGYALTPLRELPGLALRTGAARVWLKDESERLGLPAFKILGASWAIFRTLGARLGLPPDIDLETLRERLAGRPTLFAATDGNHGRAVARMAALLALPARIFVPAGTATARIGAIRGEGAELEVVDGTYDETLERAAARASDRGGLLIQDGGREPGEEIPRWIVDGYSTLFREIADQLESAGAPSPDLILVQVGVGSLAQAAIEFWRSADSKPDPTILGVEPDTAACALAALEQGRPVHLAGRQESLMAGLNCGTVAGSAWPTLRDGIDGIVTVGDPLAEEAMRLLFEEGVRAGETGAAGVAGLLELARTGELASRTSRRAPSVLLLSTEGPTDPESWQRIIAGLPRR